MSIYIVTRDDRVLRYDNPQPARTEWLMTQHDHQRYYYYYKNCDCASCDNDSHCQLIAYIPFDAVTSIGFTAPVVTQGRLLSASEKSSLASIKDWLLRRKEKGSLPRKVERNLSALEKVTK